MYELPRAAANRWRVALAHAGPTLFDHEQPCLTCKRGHLLEGDNLGVRPSGKRYCRRCEIERGRERRAQASKAEEGVA